MTISAGPFLDFENIVRVWGNTLTADLVGRTKPLALGFYQHRTRSPGRGCYAVVEVDEGHDDLTAEGLTGWATIATRIYSPTDRESARKAALAWANTLPLINSTRPQAAGAQLFMVANIGWPEWLPDEDEPCYLVRADIHAAPLP